MVKTGLKLVILAVKKIAWISLGGDDVNYRTVDVNGNILTDKSI